MGPGSEKMNSASFFMSVAITQSDTAQTLCHHSNFEITYRSIDECTFKINEVQMQVLTLIIFFFTFMSQFGFIFLKPGLRCFHISLTTAEFTDFVQNPCKPPGPNIYK